MLPAKREVYEREYRDYAQQLPVERAKPAPAPQPEPRHRHVGFGRQALMVLFILSVATVCLALVGGYERVAVAHQENVKLKSSIKQAKTYIEDLSVEIEYMMDLNSIEEIASTRLGMDYPKADQLIRIEAPVLLEKASAVDEEEQEAASGPEPSFEMPEVEKEFSGEDVEVIGNFDE